MHCHADKYGASVANPTAHTMRFPERHCLCVIYLSYTFRNLDILSLIKSFQLKLNPKKEVKVEFADQSKKLKSPFRLTWLLIQELDKQPIQFFSKLDIGANKIPIELNNQLIAPFDLGHYFLHICAYS